MHYGLALSLQHLGRVLDSAQHYHRALTLKPDYAEAALNLAALHHRHAVHHHHAPFFILQRKEIRRMGKTPFPKNEETVVF